MDNGCVCCTVRGDLVKAFMTLGRRKEKYDAVIIETTGARRVSVCGLSVSVFVIQDRHKLECEALFLSATDAKGDCGCARL